MKKIILVSILLISGLSFADGNNDWQNIDQNVIKLNALNSCQGCVLRNTSFIGADLNNASLSGANLIEADLSLANLSGVNFAQANLTNANLMGADLSGAILEGAFLCNTMMPWGLDNSSCQ